jgi:choline kinase
MGGATPKTLLPVGEKEPLLYYLLEGLKRAGVEDLLVVTGYKPMEVQNYVTEHWGAENLAFTWNARYASWGNFHTLRMALDQSPAFELLVINSDIVVHPDVYRRAIRKDGDLLLAVQRRRDLEQEDMRVQLNGDNVVSVSKDLHMARSHGEFCGVSLLRGRAHRIYGDISNGWEWRADTTGYYEDVFNQMAGRLDMRAVQVAAGEYAEVDVPDDTDGALKVIERHFQASAA